MSQNYENDQSFLKRKAATVRTTKRSPGPGYASGRSANWEPDYYDIKMIFGG